MSTWYSSCLELFPNDANVDTFDELYDASPLAPSGSIEDALPVGNALDNVESSSLKFSVSLVGSYLVDNDPKNEILNPPSSHPTPMDVKNAYLNGDLVEEVYMKPPLGLKHPPNKVRRLKRVLYGLRQAPRAWFDKFSTTISEFGFTSSPHDTALFIRKTNHGMFLLLLYVDDMIIIGDDVLGIYDLKQFLSHKFEMKDLAVLSYFLGLEVTSSNDGYLLSQTKNASDLISKVGLIDTKIVSTPLEPNIRLTPMDGSPLADATCYRQLVRSLIYLTTTQLDIAYAVHVVS
ncbi:hypothetical protein SLEP1_g11628 [Rubroshorea leprosula]|nr:hypothetical protein SLEP1_g11628 [Rubroshorea leprosula]